MEPENKLNEEPQELEGNKFLEALDRKALLNLEITSDRGEECQDMMLILGFLGLSPQAIKEAVLSFWGIGLFLE